MKRDKKKGEEGDSLSTMNKNGRFCSRAIHAPTHQHPSSTKPALNGIVSRTFVAFVRVGREKRRSRGSRRLPFSLSLSFYVGPVFERRFATSRQRWSPPSRAFVPGKGYAIDERDEKGRGPRELRRVDIERRVFARPRRVRPSRRSVRGLVFQDLSRAKTTS